MFTREQAFDVLVGAHTQEYCVVFLEQGLDIHVLPHLGIEPELHAHAFKDLATLHHDVLFQLELGDTEGQQASDFRVAVEEHGFDAGSYQHVGTTQAGGAGTDDGNFSAGIDHIGEVRAPAHSQCRIVDVLFRGTDGDRAESILQCAGALAEAVLRTDTTANLRQGVGLVAEFGGLKNISLGDQLEPVGNVVVDRALPLAVGVTALQATVGLAGHLGRRILLVDLDILGLPGIEAFLVRLLPVDFNELEIVGEAFSHGINPCFSNATAGGRGPPPWV